MQALRFYGKGDIRFEEVPIPTPGPGEVVLRIQAALTCGTDYKAYRQGHRVLLKNAPCGFGHEGAGLIADLGPDVAGLHVGDRVVAANSAPCEECFFCQRGETNLCEHLDPLNGTYAEYQLIPASIVKHNLHRIPGDLPFETAALAEPLACVLHCVDHLKVKPRSVVGVVGVGTMGALLVHGLKERAVRVVAVDREIEKLQRAGRLGADYLLSVSDQDPVTAVRQHQEINDGQGLDCVIEAVGSPGTWLQAMSMVRKGGLVCLFGGCEIGTTVPLDTHRLHYQEITITGVFHHTPFYFKEALAMLASGSVPAHEILSGRLPLAQLKDLFMEASNRPQKVAVIP